MRYPIRMYFPYFSFGFAFGEPLFANLLEKDVSLYQAISISVVLAVNAYFTGLDADKNDRSHKVAWGMIAGLLFALIVNLAELHIIPLFLS